MRFPVSAVIVVATFLSPGPVVQAPVVPSLAVQTPAVQPTLPWAAAADVGMSADGLARIAPAMQRWVDEGRVAGIVTLVARHGHLVHWNAVGFRDLETRDPLAPDDIFRIYSMTKPVTAVTVMMLVEEGKLRLEDPVSRYLPAFAEVQVYAEGENEPPRRPITVEDLLRHTAGLGYGLGLDASPVDAMYAEANVFSGDLDNLVREVAALPLVDHPGDRWIYSVANDVLGRLVEVVSGQPFDEFLAERILVPLHMIDTAFFVPPGKTDRFTTVYATGNEGALARVDQPMGMTFDRRPALPSGGGGLVSTAGDYLRFAQMLLNDGELDGVRLLRPETVALMRSNRLDEGMVPIGFGPRRLSGYGYGLGFSVLVDEDATPEPDRDGLFRWLGIASTYFWIDPETDLIGLVMTQLLPAGFGTFETEFQTLVYRALQD